jgi:2-dehydropantoate 2-reductase
MSDGDAGPPGTVLVMGAGAVGCFLGGSLASAGVEVAFVGRPAMLDQLAQSGLTLTDLGGGERTVAPGTLALFATVDAAVAAAGQPALALLCVKTGATADAARQLGAALAAGTRVVSMQNGLVNAALARGAAPALLIRPGVVGFNVAELGPGRFHRGTAGDLAAEHDPALERWLPWFARAGLRLDLHPDLLPVQWGKLLLNLNNPVNALSGRALREELLDRGYRRCYAALVDEALRALAAAGIRPAQLAALPPARLPQLMRLPEPLFRLLARRQLRQLDAKARSSMADDLARGRPTEVDAICGEVVRLAAAHGLDAPANRRISELVGAWQAQRRFLSGAELAARLGIDR